MVDISINKKGDAGLRIKGGKGRKRGKWAGEKGVKNGAVRGKEMIAGRRKAGLFDYYCF